MLVDVCHMADFVSRIGNSRTKTSLSFLHLSMSDQKLLEQDLSFESFDLDPRLARAVAQLNFTHPTLVQAKAIPLALGGKDILARARTGSGKTAAYAIPIVQKILQSKKVRFE